MKGGNVDPVIWTISSHREANSILRYNIRALSGKAYDCPIWVLVSHVEQDIKILEKNGYKWHKDRLKNHLHLFLKKCKGFSKLKPVSEVVDREW